MSISPQLLPRMKHDAHLLQVLKSKQTTSYRTPQNRLKSTKKQCIADARSQATATYDKIVRDGKEQAAALESKGRQNLDKAIELLVTRFKEQLNVSA